MKCPKCGYIGFEAVDRCRNCGYEFALAVKSVPPPADLEMRSPAEPAGPLVDLSLLDAQLLGRRRTPAGKELDLDRIIGAPDLPPDLPLFDAGSRAAQPTPAPLGTPPKSPPAAPMAMPSTLTRVPASPPAPAAPRRPLAVRRTTPALPRTRGASAEPRLAQASNLELPLPASRQASVEPITAGTSIAAAPVPRVLAASLDVLILAAIDLVVIYFTLRLCSLTVGEVGVLPMLPLAAFFLLLNGGYLVAFTTAGGQTIGKMALGLKVVGAGDEPVSIGTAAIRSAGCLLSTACLGAGLVPALVGGRAVHDRLADTRVVQVTT